MTANKLYSLLVSLFKVGVKLNKREVYDKLLTVEGMNSKKLGGYMSVLSRKGAVLVDKMTITLQEYTPEQ